MQFHACAPWQEVFHHGKVYRMRVSGSSETKTYGKSVVMRAHKERPTLPRRSFFGKDNAERSHIVNVLQALFSPTEALVSGKLSCTAIARGCRVSLEEASSIGKNPLCK